MSILTDQYHFLNSCANPCVATKTEWRKFETSKYGYAVRNIKVLIEKFTKKYLLNNYCISFD